MSSQAQVMDLQETKAAKRILTEISERAMKGAVLSVRSMLENPWSARINLVRICSARIPWRDTTRGTAGSRPLPTGLGQAKAMTKAPVAQTGGAEISSGRSASSRQESLRHQAFNMTRLWSSSSPTRTTTGGVRREGRWPGALRRYELARPREMDQRSRKQKRASVSPQWR